MSEEEISSKEAPVGSESRPIAPSARDAGRVSVQFQASSQSDAAW